MIIELFNETGDSIIILQQEWERIRDSAKCKGWKAQGTVCDIPGWKGSYRLSEAAQFKSEDLTEFQAALEQVKTSSQVKQFISNAEKIWIC